MDLINDIIRIFKLILIPDYLLYESDFKNSDLINN